MKQTTITLTIEEQVIGATVRPELPRNRRTVQLEHLAAWHLFAKDADWSRGKDVEPKDGEDYALWYQKLSERISRVARNRQFKTKVRNGPNCPQGYPFNWTVTVYWNKPVKSPLKFDDDIDGVWTLYEVRQGQKRGKILARIHATLGCDGEDLYDYLPEGTEDYLTDPFDTGHIWISPKSSNHPSYHFQFRKGKARE